MSDQLQEKEYIDKCLRLIEEKLGWEDSSKWTDSHFKYLSEQIAEETGTRISSHTLKRIFGKIKTEGFYNPQYVTKDTLAAFLGYKNWMKFKYALNEAQHASSSKEDSFQKNTVNHEKQKASVKGNKVKNKYYSIIIAILVIIVLIIGFTFYYQNKPLNKESGNIKFYCKNPEGLPPHSAVFYYDISDIRYDSVYLKSPVSNTILLEKNKNIVTKHTNYVGYHPFYLVAKKDTLAKTYVHVKTDGWKGIIYYQKDINNTTKMYYNKDMMHKGKLYIPKRYLKQKGYDTSKTYFTYYKNYKDFNCSGDNFTFQTSIKNRPIGGQVQCGDVKINIIGEFGKIRPHFNYSGCTSINECIFSEKEFHGKYKDLSMFGTNFKKYQNIKIINNNKHVKILLNDKKIFETDYKKDIGNIKGISFNFKGSAKVDYIKLLNKNQESVYEDDFEKTNQEK